MQKPTVEKFYRIVDGKVWRCDMDQAETVLIDVSYYKALQDAAQMVEHANGILRIQKERANADRGLVPKKKRSGYVLMDWRRKTIGSIDGIQIKLQTPYSINDYCFMTDIEALVKHDFLSIFPTITEWKDNYTAEFRSKRGYHLVCIYTGGKYWCVEFLAHRKDVPNIPEDLLP